MRKLIVTLALLPLTVWAGTSRADEAPVVPQFIGSHHRDPLVIKLESQHQKNRSKLQLRQSTQFVRFSQHQ